MVYEQQNINDSKFRRIFTENVDSEELVWHRDRCDREVFIEKSNGWMLQMENELPKPLLEGQKYFIPKETYHRVIKGTGDLVIEVKEDNKTFRVPKIVKENVKRGLFYLKKSGNKSVLGNRLVEGTTITKEDILEIKKYFDSKKSVSVLSENFKGKPQEDSDYIESLLRGGKAGYNWVIRESKKIR